MSIAPIAKFAGLVALAGAWLGGGLVYAQSADKAREGETVFKQQCAACHTVEPGKNRVGPSLAGVVGREAGAVQGFSYSSAMKSAHITWTEDTLEKYLADPKAVVPGTKMVYAGLKDEKKREAVIDFLEQHSKK